MESITPYTRKEIFLAYAAGENVDKPTPITREEYFLCYLGDSSASIPDPITRTEKFIAKVYNDAVETPEPTTRLEYILAYITDGSRDTFDAFTPITREEHFFLNAVEYIKQHSHIAFTLSYYNDDGSVLLYSESVTEGGNGEYKGETPTKASTAQYDYTFSGWTKTQGSTTVDADALTSVTENRNVYAVFTEVSKGYTVYFYNGETLLETVTGVPSGGTATYTGATPTSSQAGYIFSGWSPSNTNITADTSCYAQFALEGEIIDDWATISARSTAGTAQNYYSVGDCKQVHLEGTMGTENLNTDLYVYILGFNHNSIIEGNGITFSGFKTAAKNGIDIALCDSHIGSINTTGLKWFNLNHYFGGNQYGHNFGGWKGSDIRYDILGSTDTAPSGYGATATTSNVGYDASLTCATNPVANTLMSCLPSDLRAVMKPITKYTDNVGNKSNTEANVTASIDYLPLLSEYEVFGTRTKANTYEQNEQAQYAYYANGNSKIKKSNNDINSSVNWTLRSPNFNGINDFCRVKADGTVDTQASGMSIGVVPIFLVGTPDS